MEERGCAANLDFQWVLVKIKIYWEDGAGKMNAKAMNFVLSFIILLLIIIILIIIKDANPVVCY